MSDRELRIAIRRDLPAHLFRARPWRALWAVPMVAVIVGGTWAVIALPLPLVLAIPLSLAVGNTYASLLHFAHEVGHGATVRQRWLQDVILALGLAPYWVEPAFWRAWHNRAHHGHTNVPDADPDSVGTVAAYQRAGAWHKRLLLALSPGPGHWLSVLYLFFTFNVHGQVVLWSKSRRQPGFERLHRRRAGLYSAAVAGGYLALAVTSGWRGAILGVLVPTMIANLGVMAYIVTNHMLRPLSTGRDSLTTSMSVTAHPILDWLHFHVSHHIEHHLFPAMASDSLPRVRAWLERRLGERYFAPPFGAALVAIFRTPRLYADPVTLVDPERGTQRALADVERELRGVRPALDPPGPAAAIRSP
jgi:fatty acid desaturase